MSWNRLMIEFKNSELLFKMVAHNFGNFVCKLVTRLANPRAVFLVCLKLCPQNHLWRKLAVVFVRAWTEKEATALGFLFERIVFR